MSMPSPTLVRSSAALEDLFDQSFGEVVSTLILSRNPYNFNVSIGNFVPKEMPFDVVVLGSAGDLLLGGKSESSVVVFMYGGGNFVVDCLKSFGNANVTNELQKHLAKWNQDPHACTQCCIFSFHGA